MESSSFFVRFAKWIPEHKNKHLKEWGGGGGQNFRGGKTALPMQGMGLGASQVALVVKNPPVNAGDIRDAGLIPGGGHVNPLQYSCLENPTGRGAWWTTVHRVAKGWTGLKQLSMHIGN